MSLDIRNYLTSSLGIPSKQSRNQADKKEEGFGSGVIAQGNRNNTMSRFASRILKRYGDTEKAHVVFKEHAQKCDPPLPEAELNTIWNSAVKFFNKKISVSDGYVPPDQYNADFSDASLKPEDYSDIGEAKVLVQEYGSELRSSAQRIISDMTVPIGWRMCSLQTQCRKSC